MTNIIFLLWKRGNPEITGELRFPPAKAFVHKEVENGPYPALAKINYKFGGIFDALIGFQLVFDDGKGSPLFQTAAALTEELHTAEIDQTFAIGKANVCSNDGVAFEGFRLYAEG